MKNLSEKILGTNFKYGDTITIEGHAFYKGPGVVTCLTSYPSNGYVVLLPHGDRVEMSASYLRKQPKNKNKKAGKK